MAINIGGVIVDPVQQLKDLDRAEYEDSLYMFLRQAWKYIDSSPWTDGWPIEAVAEHLQAVVDGDVVAFDARQLALEALAVVGQAVELDAGLVALRRNGIELQGRSSGQSMVEEFVARPVAAPGARILVLQSNLASTEVAQSLRAQGYIVDACVAYDTVPVPLTSEIRAQLLKSSTATEGPNFQAVLLTSASVVRQFHHELGEIQSAGAVPLIGVIGRNTAAAARDLGLPVAVVASEQNIATLIRELEIFARTPQNVTGVNPA